MERWRVGARNGKKKIHALLMLWKALHNAFYAHQGSLHVMEIATVLFFFYLLFILLVAMMRQNAFWDLRHCGFSMSSREKCVFRNISTIIFFRLCLLYSNRSFWIWFCPHRSILNNLKKIKNWKSLRGFNLGIGQGQDNFAITVSVNSSLSRSNWFELFKMERTNKTHRFPDSDRRLRHCNRHSWLFWAFHLTIQNDHITC